MAQWAPSHRATLFLSLRGGNSFDGFFEKPWEIRDIRLLILRRNDILCTVDDVNFLTPGTYLANVALAIRS